MILNYFNHWHSFSYKYVLSLNFRFFGMWTHLHRSVTGWNQPFINMFPLSVESCSKCHHFHKILRGHWFWCRKVLRYIRNMLKTQVLCARLSLMPCTELESSINQRGHFILSKLFQFFKSWNWGHSGFFLLILKMKPAV